MSETTPFAVTSAPAPEGRYPTRVTRQRTSRTSFLRDHLQTFQPAVTGQRSPDPDSEIRIRTIAVASRSAHAKPCQRGSLPEDIRFGERKTVDYGSHADP
jgi:hypothetical protein